MSLHDIAGITRAAAERLSATALPDALVRAVWGVHDSVAIGTSAAAEAAQDTVATATSAAAGVVRAAQDTVAAAQNAAKAFESRLPVTFAQISTIMTVVGAANAAHHTYTAAAARGDSESARAAEATAVGGLQLAAGLGAKDGNVSNPAFLVVDTALSVAQRAAPEHREELQTVRDALPGAVAGSIVAAGTDRIDAVVRGDAAAAQRNTEHLLGGDYGEVMRGYAIAGVAMSGPDGRADLSSRAEAGSLGWLAQLGDSIGAKVYEVTHPSAEPREVAAERGVPADHAEHPTASATPDAYPTAEPNYSQADVQSVAVDPTGRPADDGTAAVATHEGDSGDQYATVCLADHAANDPGSAVETHGDLPQTGQHPADSVAADDAYGHVRLSEHDQAPEHGTGSVDATADDDRYAGVSLGSQGEHPDGGTGSGTPTTGTGDDNEAHEQ